MENDKTTPVVPPLLKSNGQPSVPTKEELQAFVQARSYYYIPKWESFDPTLKRIAPGTFNWAACFLNVFWMAYRRMYLFVIILVVVGEVCGSIVELLKLPMSATSGVGIAMMIILGRYGNSIYKKHVERKIRQIKTKIAPEYWPQAFRDSGGTSLWAPIPIIILQLLTIYGMYQGIIQKSNVNAVANDANTSTVTLATDNEFDKDKKLAENGNAEAQDKLGYCYEFGKGVAEDDAEAVKWYLKSANQNYAHAQWWLGYCYQYGAIRSALPKDATEAVKWYLKAADQGDSRSQYSVGYCYETGEGVAEDDAEAVKWYLKSKWSEAQCRLGYCYEYGKGVAQDDAEAVKWYLKAANQGDYASQLSLGYHYEYGKGVAQNFVEAYKWYNLASVFWGTNATASRDTVAASMTPEQIAEAQKLSTEFQPHIESASTDSH